MFTLYAMYLCTCECAVVVGQWRLICCCTNGPRVRSRHQLPQRHRQLRRYVLQSSQPVCIQLRLYLTTHLRITRHRLVTVFVAQTAPTPTMSATPVVVVNTVAEADASFSTVQKGLFGAGGLIVFAAIVMMAVVVSRRNTAAQKRKKMYVASRLLSWFCSVVCLCTASAI